MRYQNDWSSKASEGFPTDLDEDSSKKVYRWLLAEGMRILNAYAHAYPYMPFISPQSLSERLLDALLSKGAGYVDTHPEAGLYLMGRDVHVSLDKAEGMCDSAARSVRNNWDPEVIAKRRTAGRQGGLVRKFSDADLASVDHLSVRQAARALECNPSTIQRYRKAQALAP